MKYAVAADTDIGIAKKVNQDSVCVMTAQTDAGPIVIALVADGMGGLSKGELASAAVIRDFADWFENELSSFISPINWQRLSDEWDRRLKELNLVILEYGQRNNLTLGTTFSGMLIIGNEYMIVHVGDSRIYLIGSDVRQLTQDHTVVAREVLRGNMTAEEAENDSKKNVLLQCVGASRTVMPDIFTGTVMPNSSYLICSDGFRHVISTEEIKNYLAPDHNENQEAMKQNIRYLIDMAKKRLEKDNISAVLIHATE